MRACMHPPRINLLPNMPGETVDGVIDEFEAITSDAREVQIQTLRDILEANADSEYLQCLGLDGRTDPESFRDCVPLVTHKEIQHYIQRIADGDTSPILTGKPITTISLSSGTTQGKPKFVPFNDDLIDNTVQIYKTSFAFRNREYPVGSGKALQLIYGSKQFRTKGGLVAGTATTNVFRSDRYRAAMESIRSEACSPEEVIFSPDFHQSLYCHLLCGLLFWDEIQFVSSTFAYSIVHAFGTFEQVWEELCNDIRKGVISDRITASSIREAVSRLLKRNPDLADWIHEKCSGLNNWHGLIPSLFPNAKYVYGIMTGSMEPYTKKLRRYAGELPLLSADYGSSEGWIGVNINPKLPPESVTFAVIPNIGYFEFIPSMKIDEIPEGDSSRMELPFPEEEPEPVGLTEVKAGEEYEVVLTNFAGLYRYRLGDVVKVTGFHNSTPELRFIRRKSLVLSINIDKNTEKDLQLAVEAASSILAAREGLEVVDFTSHADVTTSPGHYVIFWEMEGVAGEEVMRECCDCLDRSFEDAGYVGSRRTNGIGALELRVVRRGTFEKVLEHFLGMGSAVSQFKTPRCVGPNNMAVFQILCDNVVNRYFSQAY
ncbi:hypothetical protein MLD38_039042 [Melastoma candidum]|uniref:Uncharacterized protein n=1 Tax=Melastoma candidum TaxID=119954 RepID=A0ACB9L1I9_9MYRT|nr:hypothetical protein MLD38_039042 [Melastoma candidum]